MYYNQLIQNINDKSNSSSTTSIGISSQIEDENEFSENETQLQNILQKGKRTKKNTKIIYELIKKLSFFPEFQENYLEKIDDYSLIQLCKTMQYEKIEPCEFIFKEGDNCNGKVYIILTGSALVIEKRNSKDVIKIGNIPSRYQKQSHNRKNSMNSNSNQRKSIITNFQENGFIIQSPAKQTSTENDNNRINHSHHSRHSRSIDISITLTNYSILATNQNTEQADYSSDYEFKILDLNYEKNMVLQPEESNKSSLEEEILNKLDSTGGIAIDYLISGQIFGENALIINKKRSSSILTTAKCELLIIKVSEYKKIKEKYNNSKKQKKDFILSKLPDLSSIDSEKILEGILNNFQNESFIIDSLITQEGKIGNHIYLLAEGSCEVSKIIVVEEQATQLMLPVRQSSNLVLARLGPGIFFGEEILNTSDDAPYQYTTKIISSEAVIYSIEKRKFLQRFPAACVLSVKRLYKKKKFFHEEVIKNKMQKKFDHRKVDVVVFPKENLPVISNNQFESEQKLKVDLQLTETSVVVKKTSNLIENYKKVSLNDCKEFINSNPIKISPRKIINQTDMDFPSQRNSCKPDGSLIKPLTQRNIELQSETKELEIDESLRKQYVKLNNRTDLLCGTSESLNFVPIKGTRKSIHTPISKSVREGITNFYDQLKLEENRKVVETQRIERVKRMQELALDQDIITSNPIDDKLISEEREIFSARGLQPKSLMTPFVDHACFKNLKTTRSSPSLPLFSTNLKDLSRKFSNVGVNHQNNVINRPNDPMKQIQKGFRSTIKNSNWDNYFDGMENNMKKLGCPFQKQTKDSANKIADYKISFGKEFGDNSERLNQMIKIQHGFLKMLPEYPKTHDVNLELLKKYDKRRTLYRWNSHIAENEFKNLLSNNAVLTTKSDLALSARENKSAHGSTLVFDEFGRLTLQKDNIKTNLAKRQSNKYSLSLSKLKSNSEADLKSGTFMLSPLPMPTILSSQHTNSPFEAPKRVNSICQESINSKKYREQCQLSESKKSQMINRVLQTNDIGNKKY